MSAPFFINQSINMKFKFLFLIISIFTFQFAFAQKTIKGVVTDASGSTPLSGATISVAGKAVATSDANGAFSIPCNGGNTEISVSFVGYGTVKYTVKDCDVNLQVTLNEAGSTLGNVEITATSNQNKSLLYQPASISKLNRAELNRSTGLFLDDAINTNVPGVIMQRRAVSSGQSFNIRGYGNGSGGTGRINSNFDGQGSKVYLNGIPITDAEGITVMDDIDFGSIGNVEVTKGPAGTIYGLAVAGVVNLKTIRPEKGKTSFTQDLMVGSYGLQRYTTHFAMGAERSSLLVNYGHQFTEGYTYHNNSEKDFVNVSGEFKPNDKQTVNMYIGYSKSYDQRIGELTLSQWANNDYTGNIDYVKRDGHAAMTSFRAGVSHTYNFCKSISNTTTVFGTGATINASSAGGWTDKDPLNYGLRSTFNTNFALGKGLTLSGITGVELQSQTAQTIGYTMVKDPRDPLAVWVYGTHYYWTIGAANSNKYTTSSTGSYFTEWTLALPKDLSVTAGIGVSNMRINLSDRLFANNQLPTRFDTAYKSMVSPHFALNKVFNKNFSAYVSWSKGYKAPTSSYFYIPFTGKLNNNLKPEVGTQFEIGTKGSLLNGKVNFQLAYFDAIFADKMSAVNVLNAAGTATLYTYLVNGGKQNDKGFEGIVKVTAYESDKSFFSSVRAFANVTASNFKYENYSFHFRGVVLKDSVVHFDGKDVAGVPKLTANLGVDFNTKPGIYGNFTWSHKGAFPITSDNINMTKGYNLTNAKIGYQGSLSKHFDLDLYFGLNNIGGVRYPIAVFINQLPDAYLAGPRGSNYFTGFSLRYNL